MSMKALIHYPSMDESPIGIWWVDPLTNKASHYYTDEDSPEAARGRMLVMQKSTTGMDWHAWFDYLTQRAPYFGTWEKIEIMDQAPNVALKAMQARGSQPIPA